MTEYVTHHPMTARFPIVNVDLICKNWNNKFLISTWINADNKESYTFLVKTRRKEVYECKLEISKEQAMEIVVKLKLVHIKSNLFKSAGCYYTKRFVRSEISRMKTLKRQKTRELKTIDKKFKALHDQVDLLNNMSQIYSEAIKEMQ